MAIPKPSLSQRDEILILKQEMTMKSNCTSNKKKLWSQIHLYGKWADLKQCVGFKSTLSAHNLEMLENDQSDSAPSAPFLFI